MGGRKKPFGGKAKKAQLQAKREKKRQLDAPWNPDDVTIVTSAASSSHMMAAPQPLNGEKDLKTVFAKEPLEFIRARKKDGYRGLVRAPVEWSPYENGLGSREMELEMPTRPIWSKTLSPEDLEIQERNYFEQYLKDIYAKYPLEELNYFEHNLEVWRQLWRTIEKADIILMVIDARFPILHFSQSLYEHVTSCGKTVVLCLNKIDLIPPTVVSEWIEYFAHHFPLMPVAPVYASSKTLAPAAGQVLLPSLTRKAILKALSQCQLIRNGICTSADKYVFPKSENVNAHLDRGAHIVIGTVGDPNMGKSTVINQLFGYKVCSESATPGHTKHFQTLFLTPTLCFCDCPGVVFPKRGIGREMQVLFGSYPIAQTREPYSAIRYLAEHCHPSLSEIYHLPEVSEGQVESPYSLSEAFAEQRGYFVKGGNVDVYRGANRLLRDALLGRRVLLWFGPPGSKVLRNLPRDHTTVQCIVEEASSEEEDNEQEDEVSATAKVQRSGFELLQIDDESGSDSDESGSTSPN